MTKGLKITTVHIAGPSVSLEGAITIQRCCICGHKLYDSRDGDPKLISGTFEKIGWPIGVFIREIGGKYEQIPRSPNQLFNKAPKELCLDLVER